MPRGPTMCSTDDRPPTQDHQTAPDRTPFQFTLRTLMVITTVTAVVLSGLSWLTAITVFLFVLTVPLVLTVTLIYGRGNGRTFCIGALFPAGLSLSYWLPWSALFYHSGSFSPGDDDRLVIIIFLVGYCIFTVSAGLFALWIRKMVEGPGWRAEQEAILHTSPPPASEDLPVATEPGPYWDCVSCGKTVPVDLESCSNCNAPRIV